MGCDFCERCIESTDIDTIKNKRKFSRNFFDFISDLFKVFSGDADKEQETKTYLASWLKVKLEKNCSRVEKEKFLREIIHWAGPEAK